MVVNGVMLASKQAVRHRLYKWKVKLDYFISFANVKPQYVKFFMTLVITFNGSVCCCLLSNFIHVVLCGCLTTTASLGKNKVVLMR